MDWIRNIVFKAFTVIGTIWFILIILNLGNKYLKSINYGKDFGKSDFEISQYNNLSKKKPGTFAGEELKKKWLIETNARKTCGILGFEPGSKKFIECQFKIYKQKIDEKIVGED
jgi:hypothetical protein